MAAQVTFLVEGDFPNDVAVGQTDAAPCVCLDQARLAHCLHPLVADLNDVQENVRFLCHRGSHLDAPLAHHGQVLGIQPSFFDSPILARRPELFARAANSCQFRFGWQQRSAQHASFIVICSDGPAVDCRFVGRVDQPVFLRASVSGRYSVEDHEEIGHQKHQLPCCEAAFLREIRLAVAANGPVLVAGRRIASHVDELVGCLERLNHRSKLAVLSAVVAFHLATPIASRRFAGLMNDDAVVGDRLGVVVRQMLAIGELVVSSAGIECQEPAVVDHEVQRVKVTVLAQNPATREEAIRIVRSGPGAHEDLPHSVEVPRVRQDLGSQWGW